MCFAHQRRALFRHLNFQKWSEHGVLCTFWLGNVLCATTACTFSTSQLPKWKCALRHNGVHFFDSSTSKSGPRLVCLVLFRNRPQPASRPAGQPATTGHPVTRPAGQQASRPRPPATATTGHPAIGRPAGHTRPPATRPPPARQPTSRPPGQPATSSSRPQAPRPPGYAAMLAHSDGATHLVLPLWHHQRFLLIFNTTCNKLLVRISFVYQATSSSALSILSASMRLPFSSSLPRIL